MSLGRRPAVVGCIWAGRRVVASVTWGPPAMNSLKSASGALEIRTENEGRDGEGPARTYSYWRSQEPTRHGGMVIIRAVEGVKEATGPLGREANAIQRTKGSSGIILRPTRCGGCLPSCWKMDAGEIKITQAWSGSVCVAAEPGAEATVLRMQP